MRKAGILFGIFCALFCTAPARAQYLGQTSPQTVTQQVLNAATGPIVGPAWNTSKTTCAPPAAGACGIQNLGQNYHILTYMVTGGTPTFQLRLEYSDDGVTFNPLTDDATSQASGSVYGQGYHPIVRVNLVSFTGSGSISAFYSGTSTGTMQPTGTLNQSQQFKKIVATAATSAGAVNYVVNPPCANINGTVFFDYSSNPGSGTVTVSGGADSQSLLTGIPQILTVAASTSQQSFNLFSQTATYINLNVNVPVGAVYTMQYIFNCPAGSGGQGTGGAQVVGLLQPFSIAAGAVGGQSNAEFVSATNSAISQTFAALGGLRVSFFSVSARCSAGTAGLKIQDGATTIWSTGAAEVGTTTFKFQWSPGLANAVGDTATIAMTTCGAGNVGTLDVQASQN